MAPANYSNIESLIADQEVRGRNVHVTFRCATTGVESTANAPIKRGAGLKSTAEHSVKKGLWSSLRRAVSSTISDTLGSGVAGRIARDVANKSMTQKQKSAAHTTDELRDAAVSAFASIQSKFRWDEGAGTWVGVEAPATPFAELLATAPVTESYDRGVLARALVEVCCADGSVGDEERALVSSFLDPSIGTFEELSTRDPLSATELRESSASAREAIYMLSWACAMCDEDVASAEATRIHELRDGLDLATERADELKTMAQHFLFDQALAHAYPGGKRDDEAFSRVLSMTEGLGLDSTVAEQFDVGYRKRNGIV